ncbi:hypothetical protein [Campylobacter jejuni]
MIGNIHENPELLKC